MDFTQILMAIGTVILGWLSHYMKKNESRLDAKNKEHDIKLAELRQDISDLKSKLPLLYVTRDDYIRASNTIETKIEKLCDNVITRGGW